MSAQRSINPLHEPQWEGRVGEFTVEVLTDGDRGTLVLTPPTGEALQIRISGGELSMTYAGPSMKVSAPDAKIAFEARSIALQAEEVIEVHGGTEVDIHSGADVEVRADHHVNLWGFGVNAGD